MEKEFLRQLKGNFPENIDAWMIYIDWLEEREPDKADFLRMVLAIRHIAPDHAARAQLEERYSKLKNRLPHEWTSEVVPVETDNRPHAISCNCFPDRNTSGGKEVYFHTEPQDTECDAWKEMHDLIQVAADSSETEFSPIKGWSIEKRKMIKRLPTSIGKLKHIKSFHIYGSGLQQIPTEIGLLTDLRKFTPYTSYRLHWLPYELTRCKKMNDSSVSTRALYGNFKYRTPFPRLTRWQEAFGERKDFVELLKSSWQLEVERNCSVCDQPYVDEQEFRVWISLAVGTDVWPLLVNACSQNCLLKLPKPHDRFVQELHMGGLEIKQPDPHYKPRD